MPDPLVFLNIVTAILVGFALYVNRRRPDDRLPAAKGQVIAGKVLAATAMVSKEGYIKLPNSVQNALGIAAGDRVRFVVTGPDQCVFSNTPKDAQKAKPT